jgi:hypothetical protein
MIRRLALHEVSDKVDLVPQAMIALPVSYFVDKYGPFDTADDDLATWEGAAFSIEGRLLFALMHYPGEPADTVTVYLPRTVLRSGIPDALAQIVREMKLPKEVVSWQRDKAPLSHS